MPPHRPSSRFQALALLGLALSACREADPKPEPQPQAPAVLAREDKLVVFAASSLREAFTAMAEAFKRDQPGIDVAFNFAGSQELRTQIEQGAPADVFASADLRHMNELRAASRVDVPTTFANNEPVLVVSTEKAGTLHSLAELPTATRIVIGGPEVPIGRYTLQILDNAKASLGADFRTRVEAHVVSRELNVRQVLSKISLGEAEAGFVYRTDAQSARAKVSVVTIPPEINVIAEYPIASVVGAAYPKLAAAWLSFVSSEAGQRILREAGFVAPKPAAHR